MFKLRNIVLLLCLVIIAVPVLAQDSSHTVSLGSSDELGSFLVGPNGMTLYLFTHDPINNSVCYDQCATSWPPLTVDSADNLSAADGIPGTLSTVTRTDGTLQVAYNGMPLYYWFKDAAPGDTTGNRVGNVWWIVPPSTVSVQNNPTLGQILVGPNGMTLYLFTKDSKDTTTCYDQCATSWPPLLVDSADAIVPGINLLGTLGTTARTEGTLQVTYDGWPLYFWKDDKAIGDTTGENVGKVWFVLPPETVGIHHDDMLGDILIAPNGMTLYTFAKDTAGVSNCSGDCAKNWPAFTVGKLDKLATGDNISQDDLATIAHDDNTVQVTYKSLPLYFFAKDAAPGDTSGNGVGESWAVVAP